MKSLGELNPNGLEPFSLESYLAKFTSRELLSDKIVCENCSAASENHIHQRGIRGKQGVIQTSTTTNSNKVYTNATKQYLVCELPAVLTIHLKRFQQHGWHLEKSNKFVSFPIMLDMAPFTSQMCINKSPVAELPNSNDCQATAEHAPSTFYSLYGIVEHSGRLNSGHYTAFVRANNGGCDESLKRGFLGTHRLCHLKSAIEKWRITNKSE